MTESTTTIRRLLIAAALVLGGIGAVLNAGDTVEVRHAMGVTAVPVNPRRVVTFDLSILDSLDALGIPGLELAIPKQNIPPYLSQYAVDTVVDAGGMKEPNLERIYEFRPDVIFVSGRQTDYYDKLSRIAPTVSATIDFTRYLDSFRDNIHLLGAIFAVPEKAASMADAMLARIAATAEEARRGNLKALIVMVNDGNISAYGPGSRFGIIHDILGVQPADEGIRASIHGQSVDYEYIARINPDILYVISRNAAIGRTSRGPSTVLDNELVMNTTAGKTGRIVNLDSSVWYLSGGGLESLELMLTEVAQSLR